MGSGFVCTPAAPQGPPKQVEGERNEEKMGKKLSEGCRIDKANRQGSRRGVRSRFEPIKQSSKGYDLSFLLKFYLTRCPKFPPLQDFGRGAEMSERRWQKEPGLTGLTG